MKLKVTNENYAATVVRVRKILDLPGLDNLVGLPVLGYQALTTKSGVQIDDLVIVFTAETQLSQEYAANNNLHRHENLNADMSVKGYLEDNRRIKAIKLRGHRSDALVMPLSSLNYLPIDPSKLKEGDVFDTIDDFVVCQKYLVPTKGSAFTAAQPRKNRVAQKHFPRHFETANLFRNTGKIAEYAPYFVTQKLHGTSVRIGHTLVDRELKWYEKLAERFGVKVRKTEWDYIYGSRNQIKDPNADQFNFYENDLYTTIGKQLKHTLPKGTIVYGEIIGWVPGTETPIQTGYTYGLPKGTAELYVYRVAHLNEDGNLQDYSWEHVKEFCENRGIKHVPELSYDIWVGGADPEYITNRFLDKRLADTFAHAVDTGGVVDEGICLRFDTLIPTIYKAKSPIFLQHESKLLDEGIEDVDATN